METTLSQERIIISEDKTGLDALTRLAETNVATLNAILEYAPELNTEEKIMAAIADRDFILKKFFAINPDAKRLWELSNIPFNYPDELEQLKRVLSTVTVRTFMLVWYNAKLKPGRWQIDKSDFEAQADRFRVIASTPEEIARWEFAQKYVQFLRDDLKAGPIAMRKFTGELMEYQPSRGYVPNPNFVKNSYRF